MPSKRIQEKRFSDEIGDSLLSLEGFDLGAALTRVMGKRELLAKLFLVFIETHRGDAKALRRLLFQQKWQEAADLSHKVKGAAANLGALSLSQCAAKIENRLKQGAQDISNELIDEFQENIYRAADVLNFLSPDLSDPTATVIKPVTREEVSTQLYLLRANLDEDLGEAKKVLEKLRKLTQGTEYENLAQDIDSSFYRFNMLEIHQLIERWQ